MKYILILTFLFGFSVFGDINPVEDEGVPLGRSIDKPKRKSAVIDPITGKPLYEKYQYTKYAEIYENPEMGNLYWIKWDYNADSTQRVMWVKKGVSLYMKDLLKKRFEKIKMRRKGEVNDKLYLKMNERLKFPKYDLHLYPEMKDEFITAAKKDFFERHPYRIMEDTKGRKMLVTGQASPYVPSHTQNGKDTLIQVGYEDTFYLDEREKYGKEGEPILVHAVLGEIGDEVQVPLWFKGKVVAVAIFSAYGAEALAPRDELRWDKYPFVDLVEGKKLIEQEIVKRYTDEKNLPEVEEIAYFGAGGHFFVCDQRKEVADWASPDHFGGTAEVCFVAALLSDSEVLFINPMTKEVR